MQGQNNVPVSLQPQVAGSSRCLGSGHVLGNACSSSMLGMVLKSRQAGRHSQVVVAGGRQAGR